MLTDKQLIKILREKEKDTLKGVIDYQNLTLEEKNRIFDLVADEKHIDKKLEREKDLLLMLIVSLKKKERGRIIQLKKIIKSLDLLSNKVIKADKKELEVLDKEVNSLF